LEFLGTSPFEDVIPLLEGLDSLPVDQLATLAELLAGDGTPPSIDCTKPDPDQGPQGANDSWGVGAWNKNKLKEMDKYLGYISTWGDLANNIDPATVELGKGYVVGPDIGDYKDPVFGQKSPYLVHGSPRALDPAIGKAGLPERGVVTAEAVTENGTPTGNVRWVAKSARAGIGKVSVPTGWFATDATNCNTQVEGYADFISGGVVASVAELINFLYGLDEAAIDLLSIEIPGIKPIWDLVQLYCDEQKLKPGEKCVDAQNIETLGKGLEKVAKFLDRFEAQLPGLINTLEKLDLDPDTAEDLEKLAIGLRDNFGSLRILSDLSGGISKVLDKLGSVLNGLNVGLIDLQKTLTGAGEGLSADKVSLPKTSQVVAELVEKALSTPNGQLLVGGLEETRGGIGEITSQLGAYLGGLVATLSSALTEIGAKGPTVKAKLQDTVKTLNADVNAAKGAVGGMMMAAHSSPLPYGGNPQDAPEGTALAGAYEFRVDAADHDGPATDVRFILGLIALFGAGGIGVWLSRRGAA
jgi:hypothetical protein